MILLPPRSNRTEPLFPYTTLFLSTDAPPHSMCFVYRGLMLVRINRSDYWQCAYLIAKGGFDALKTQGLEAFRAGLAASAPFMATLTATLANWDQIKLLTVQVNQIGRAHV